MRITPPSEKMTGAEHEAALAAFLSFLERLDTRLAEAGSPHIVEHRMALLLDFGHGCLPITPNCAVLLALLQNFALQNFQDAGHYMSAVCPRIARQLWFEGAA